MIKITHKSANLFYKIIKHPISAIIISLIIGYIFYNLSLKSKDPLYNVSESNLIAENLNNNEIDIKWRDTSVNNIHQITLSIWNNGSDIIDYSDFVKNIPLTFHNEGDVKILNVKSIKRSRPNIIFNSKILNDSIFFSLSNSEALENGDGEMFTILYSKINEKKWNLTGRIKGSKNGFGFSEVVNSKNDPSNYTTYITIGLILIILIRVGVSIYKFNAVHLKYWEIFFITTYFLLVYIVPYYLSDGELLSWMN